MSKKEVIYKINEVKDGKTQIGIRPKRIKRREEKKKRNKRKRKKKREKKKKNRRKEKKTDLNLRGEPTKFHPTTSSLLTGAIQLRKSRDRGPSTIA